MQPTILQIVKRNLWSVAEGEHKNKPLVIRYRGEFRKKPDLSAYPRLVRVVWSFDANPSGMPSTSTSQQMSVFEDRLVAAVEPSQTSVLVAVITNSGQREWLFYTSDVAKFGQRLTDMPQEKERYPIAISSESDPAWNALYNDILSGVGE
ncbi:MAG: DUF695 domain-containing protein [Burkholderiales bacterium]|nr:DUF695 domain-containing protein [Burkholderiales bacterium]